MALDSIESKTDDTKPDEMKTGGIAVERLRSLIDRIERLEEERKALGSDIKDIYEFVNRSKGSLAALLLCASALGGVVVGVVSWLLARFLK